MILISAGHHAYKKGARFNGWYEYDETKIWASLIAYYIGKGAMVVPNGMLEEKINFINKYDAKIAIEIHFNSAKDKDGSNVGNGSETLYFPNSTKGKEYAEKIQDSLAKVFPPNRGAKEGWYQMNPKKGPDRFLARTNCTALIIEPDFIHRSEIIIGNREEACSLIAETLVKILEGESGELAHE